MRIREAELHDAPALAWFSSFPMAAFCWWLDQSSSEVELSSLRMRSISCFPSSSLECVWWVLL